MENVVGAVESMTKKLSAVQASLTNLVVRVEGCETALKMTAERDSSTRRSVSSPAPCLSRTSPSAALSSALADAEAAVESSYAAGLHVPPEPPVSSDKDTYPATTPTNCCQCLQSSWLF